MEAARALSLKRLGIDTYKEAVIYLHSENPICRSEGLQAETRVKIQAGDQVIIATLNIVHSDLLAIDEIGLSEYAWQLLKADENKTAILSHPKTLESLSFIHAKIYEHELEPYEIQTIIQDVVSGYLSDVQIASFLTACAGGRLNLMEITALSESMINAGESLKWSHDLVVDKHCIGGLPGNRTTLILVPIVAAFGLIIPKTSSRAITSPAGTADTMEVFAPVNLDTQAMRRVVEAEGGCIVWGGSVSLSPVDDALIRVERALDLDSEGQMVASVLSKKIAAGSNHILIDVPIGPTAKVRSMEMANCLKHYLEEVGSRLGVKVRVMFNNGDQPVGRGIGPVLEAFDVMSVLKNEVNAPNDLRERALCIAGQLIEFSPEVSAGEGKKIAEKILQSGEAWEKFQAICRAQGGMTLPKKAEHSKVVTAKNSGGVLSMDNRRLSRVAKLAGAPHFKAAGVELMTSVGEKIDQGAPLFIVYSESESELNYALDYVETHPDIIDVGVQ